MKPVTGAKLLVVSATVALMPDSIWACAACYGQSDSAMAAGMNWGIFSLLAVIVTVLGAIAAFPSYFALLYRAKTRLDDSLDVVAAHGVGGIVGALLTGVFANKWWNAAGNNGLLHGNGRQVGVQAVAILATLAWSGIVTFIILKLIALVWPLRAESRDEGLGLDFTQHGEEAYSRGEGAILVLDGRTE